MNTPSEVLMWLAFACGVIAGCIQIYRDRSAKAIFLTVIVVSGLVYGVGFLLLS